jgi:hypothetical protein
MPEVAIFGLGLLLAPLAGVKVIDDPLDPVFVTLGPARGRVELQIGEGSRARYCRLSPGDARRVAQALLQIVDEMERSGRPHPQS